jgi:hypothetical protein
MTFEGKFIQKEDAMKVPHEILLTMAMIPFQYEKTVVHKRCSKFKNELH